MVEFSDKLQVALIASGATFGFGIGLLLLREWLERIREAQRKHEELSALLQAYIAEIVPAAERCAQFVRQVCMHQVSRAKLSLLVGPGKIDRVGALGGSPECMRALHDVYRLFDQVEHQIAKRKPDEFAAILAFVQGEHGNLTEGFRKVLHHSRDPHGATRHRVGRRLLLRVGEALLRVRKDFLLGVEDGTRADGSLTELVMLERRFAEATEECVQWFGAYTIVINLAFGDQGTHQQVLDDVKLRPKLERAKTLRALVGMMQGYLDGTKSGQPLYALDWQRLVRAGYEISELPIPPAGSEGMGIEGARAALQAWWLENDRQPYDV